MLLNAIAILNLGLDNKMVEENGPKYVDMINQDEKDLGEVKHFLSELRADPILTKQITELKNINFERAHLESQRTILESVSSLKDIKGLLKKATKPEEFVDIYHNIIEIYTKLTPKYPPIVEVLNFKLDGVPEEFANKKLETFYGKLKDFQDDVHESIRTKLLEFGPKLLDAWKLPAKPETPDGNKDLPQIKVKLFLTDLVVGDINESKLVDNEIILKPDSDLITELYLSKTLKSMNYYFLSENELNQIDHIEWMLNFIVDSLKVNILLFQSIGMAPNIISHLVNVFLRNFLQKLKLRFSQDIPHYLEHDSLFTSYLGSLKEHLSKVRNLFDSLDVEADVEKNYELSEIYKDSSKLLDKLIGDEYEEFNTKILDKINKMDIQTQERPDQKRFDVLLAEYIENFVFLFSKIVRKYEVWQQDYIPKYVKARILDRAMNDLVNISLKGLLVDVTHAKTGPRLFVADTVLSIVDFLFSKLAEVEDFIMYDYDPGYKPMLLDFRRAVFKFIEEDVEFFIQEIKKPLKSYLNSNELRAAYNSEETVEKKDIFVHKDLKHVLEKFDLYTRAGQEKLNVELRARFYDEIFTKYDKIIIDDLLKRFNFTHHGLNFVGNLLIVIIGCLREINFDIFATKELRYKEMIKYSKQEKHVQAKLVEKINGIRQSTLTDDIKESKIKAAISSMGFDHLKEDEILSLHDVKLL